jgi:hypothetical protein
MQKAAHQSRGHDFQGRPLVGVEVMLVQGFF